MTNPTIQDAPDNVAEPDQAESADERMALLADRISALEDGMNGAQDAMLYMGERIGKLRRALLAVADALTDLQD